MEPLPGFKAISEVDWEAQQRRDQERWAKARIEQERRSAEFIEAFQRVQHALGQQPIATFRAAADQAHKEMDGPLVRIGATLMMGYLMLISLPRWQSIPSLPKLLGLLFEIRTKQDTNRDAENIRFSLVEAWLNALWHARHSRRPGNSVPTSAAIRLEPSLFPAGTTNTLRSHDIGFLTPTTLPLAIAAFSQALKPEIDRHPEGYRLYDGVVIHRDNEGYFLAPIATLD